MKKLLLICFVLPLFISCKKEETKPDILIVKEITSIKQNSATVNFRAELGNCADKPIEMGFCISKTPEPVFTDRPYSAVVLCTHAGGKGVDQLQSKTTYYVRAYMKKETGVVYSNEMSFTTL